MKTSTIDSHTPGIGDRFQGDPDIADWKQADKALSLELKAHRAEQRMANIFELAKKITKGARSIDSVIIQYKGKTLNVGISELEDRSNKKSQNNCESLARVQIRDTEEKKVIHEVIVRKDEKSGERTSEYHDYTYKIKQNKEMTFDYKWRRTSTDKVRFSPRDAANGIPELYEIEEILQIAVDQESRQSE